VDVVEVETIIVGAGVIGLAIGAEIARQGGTVFVLEGESAIGSGISSRNSEVIHSGIYYPEKSLKCQLCVEGRPLLYAYCDSHGVTYRKCGKLVVATQESEISKIEAIARQAGCNGVKEAELIDGKKARELEPALAAVAALHVPETGIIDSHAYMSSLSNDIESGGGAILLRHKVLAGRRAVQGFELSVQTPSGPLMVKTNQLILSAGLSSHHLAGRLEGYSASGVAPLSLAKGSYFAYSGPAVFTRLIYPAPVDGGLGTHLTLDLSGRMRFGPDVEWLETSDPERIDYNVDAARSLLFYESVRRYWPGLPDGGLVPDYAGVRPKLTGPGDPAADFLFHGPQDHGIPGFVALYGIESPGLTSSLSIARHVAGLLKE
jgi:L-2-hydroxyglutarate oxidase LhgO